MTDSTETQTPPAPVVAADVEPDEVAPGVYVIPDGRVPLVPNIGIVVAEREALVVDTGMGPKNGRRVLDKARALTDKPLVLTITHFHPEHGFGAQELSDARIVYNRAQQEELAEKGASYLDMFRSFGDAVAEQLEGVELVDPDEVYDGELTLDLGGTTVELREFGLAHTRGDQVVFLPGQGVLFTGDLVETRLFPIFPWFPPDDADVNGSKWIDVLGRLEALEPDVVVPGHGEVGGPDLIGQVRAYLEDVRERVSAASDGRGSEEVKAAPGARDPRGVSDLGCAGMDRLRRRVLLRRAQWLTASASRAAGPPTPASFGCPRARRSRSSSEPSASAWPTRRSTRPAAPGSTTACRFAIAVSSSWRRWLPRVGWKSGCACTSAGRSTTVSRPRSSRRWVRCSPCTSATRARPSARR